MLLLLTSLILINLNKFEAATNSKFGGGFGVPKTVTASFGLLAVTVDLNMTLDSPSGPFGAILFSSEPLHGIYVSITNMQTGSFSVSNLTNSNGQIVFDVPPAKYEVAFVDWRLNYSSVTAEVYTGQVTHVQAYLNATGYAAQSFDIVDPYSTNWALSWEQLYMQVPSDQVVGGAGYSTYIQTNANSLISTLMNGNLTELTPASIIGSASSQNSQWVSIRVGLPIQIQSIQSLQLLSMNATYTVST